MSPKKKSSESAQSFEQSLQELQQIVDSLEQGKSGLEESLTQFERGIHLLRECYAMLDHAEKKVELLTGFTSEGTPVTQPMVSSETASGKETPPKKSPSSNSTDSNSGSLFDKG